ncbi:nuclease-related domain-containing protein [Caldimonas taiwanensis]|uniref:nuclease-related domain-containing protein n=1 Tax=Caldimonas taiwanensis TaxID=307483 RepID=UPI000783CCC6|nr:nuclease-related domain-containing protein [Caldimonas taiwanensis]
MKDKGSRLEHEVFTDLAALCVRPGYIHALAFLCFRDNIILYAGQMTEADMLGMFSPSRLIRTEINTLIGLMVKADIDWALPAPQTLQEYINTSENLLEELHHIMSSATLAGLTKEAIAAGSFDPFNRGEALREPIFYSGESAYTFQYLDFAVRKYAADASWLQANRGFTIDDARAVALAIERVQSDRFSENRKRMRKLNPHEWTMLPCFAVTVAEVAAKAGLAPELTECVLTAFTLPDGERNSGFGALQDFNAICATPLLRMPSGEFLSLQSYALAEAIYDSPFYWMAQDRAYLPTLTKHRGDFTESFVAERLGLVFGRERVYGNVDIWETKATKAGEIDVLVVWGDRAIVVQAKSKRLTLEARKGNDQVIRDDFKKSVQDAYDQAVQCAQCLGDKRFTLTAGDGREIVLRYELKEIYVFCVVSDHYPALSFQARQFLKTVAVPRVQPPLVMDVFTIDAMTEMLQSPLHFLSYVNQRANYADRLLASQELTILAYHLKHNLWIDPEVNWMHLGDDFSAGLDIAMAVRRTGVTGAATPDGILTRFDATTLGRVVKEIEARPEPATIDLGLLLLSLSEDTVKTTSQAIDKLALLASSDGKHHDLTLGFRSGETGLTVHVSDDADLICAQRLRSHCERRKYKERANQWFGLCMSPKGPNVRFGISLSYPWAHSEAMDAVTRDMRAPMPPAEAFTALLQGKIHRKKIGRNAPCPCGSGKKYKKCCLQ